MGLWDQWSPPSIKGCVLRKGNRIEVKRKNCSVVSMERGLVARKEGLGCLKWTPGSNTGRAHAVSAIFLLNRFMKTVE